MKNKKIVLITFTVIYFILMGPALASSDPIQIETAADFDSIRNNLNKNYILMNNITLDFSDPENKKWKSVGNYEYPFTGNFDGNNKTITLIGNPEGIDHPVQFTVSESSIGLEKSEFDGHGLFGNVKGDGETSGIIENLTVILQMNVSNEGSDSPIGVLVGYLGSEDADEAAVVRNCFVYSSSVPEADSSEDDISYSVSGKCKTGGLVGVVNHGNIEGSGAGIDVLSSKISAGGLVGYIFNGTVTKCYSSGGVFADDSNAGGLIGEIEYASVSQCYAAGDVLSSKNAGGLVGYVSRDSIIENTYATGDVFTTEENAGGLVGFVAKYITLEISNSYA